MRFRPLRRSLAASHRQHQYQRARVSTSAERSKSRNGARATHSARDRERSQGSEGEDAAAFLFFPDARAPAAGSVEIRAPYKRLYKAREMHPTAATYPVSAVCYLL